ncbi:MAG: sodium:solute symporter [Saprospiraceae bacterium]
MSNIDWIILVGTLAFIVLYGVWKTRNVKNVESYLLGDRDLKWWTIGLSIMATQASAITFLSTPGQAYEDGMRFAQFYFGLPIAMVIIAIFFLPIFYRLKVYTAYEYLESRFDLRTRTLTAVLFLVQRGLAAGITIYAPAIILSTILGWDLFTTVLIIGVVVIFYTVMGGTKAVSVTQKQQMIIILGGMIVAAIIILNKLPADVSFQDTLGVAGKMGKLQVVDFSFDLSNRYTIWSGILGGTFLFLSYFGTDQSQVQRYLSGKSLTESRLGLLFNGIFKVPMQFLVLFVGILVFMFYQFTPPPLHFNRGNVDNIEQSSYAPAYKQLETDYQLVYQEKQTAIKGLMLAIEQEDETAIQAAQTQVKTYLQQDSSLRAEAKTLIQKQNTFAKVKDTDYVFISFIVNYLPVGLVGLLLAVIFSAAMSSTASELNALATTTVIDLYRRSIVKDRNDQHYLKASKFFTILWGIIALSFAATADLFENLIQAVNIIGSLFYGAILGIFLIAFLFKRVQARAVFLGAIVGEIIVLITFTLSIYGYIELAYLWLNLIGCIIVILLSLLFQAIFRDPPPVPKSALGR